MIYVFSPSAEKYLKYYLELYDYDGIGEEPGRPVDIDEEADLCELVQKGLVNKEYRRENGSSKTTYSLNRNQAIEYLKNREILQYKEARIMFVKLTGEARQLLQEIHQNKHRIDEYINEDLKDSEQRHETLQYLNDMGFFDSQETVKNVLWDWHVKLSYSGLHYFELEKEYETDKKPFISQTTNFGDITNYGNFIGKGGDNLNQSINYNKENEEILKLINQMKETLKSLDVEKEITNSIVDDLNSIEEQIISDNPKKLRINKAIESLKQIIPTIKDMTTVTALMIHLNTLAPVISNLLAQLHI